MSHGRLTMIRGDVLDAAKVGEVVAGVYAVLSALGQTKGSPKDVQTRGTQNIVETLHRAGVVTDRRAGNQRLLRMNTLHPLYPELRSMGMKTFGLADRLREAFSPVRQNIETAFVFGSVAADTATAASDIDLLVVGDLDFFEVSTLLADAEKDLGRPIHLSLVDAAEWATWRTQALGDAVMRGPKIMVVGDDL